MQLNAFFSFLSASLLALFGTAFSSQVPSKKLKVILHDDYYIKPVERLLEKK